MLMDPPMQPTDKCNCIINQVHPLTKSYDPTLFADVF